MFQSVKFLKQIHQLSHFVRSRNSAFRCLIVFALACTFHASAFADLTLTEVGVAVTEDFDDFRGLGFAADPVAGQLDSDTFRVTGLSDGDGVFGGTHDTGDFARGTSTGGVTTGGVYAFDVSGGSGPENFAIGIQQTGGDFTPGDFTIRFSNQTGQALNFLEIDASLFFLNNAERSSIFTFQGSLDDVNYVDFFSTSSDEASTPGAVFEEDPINGIFSLPVPIVDGAEFFIRIVGDDLAGTGSRDEFALDSFSVRGLTAIPEPGSATVLAMIGLFGISRRRR